MRPELSGAEPVWPRPLRDATITHIPRPDHNEEIAGAVARGWCHGADRHEAMDADLAAAIAEEVLAVLWPIGAAKRVFRTPRKVVHFCSLVERRGAGAERLAR